MTSKKSSVGILGAGISGLSVAYALNKKGVDVSVYEQEESVGGVIQSKQIDGWLVEQGPNTILVRSEKVWNVIHDLNLDAQVLEAGRESKNRFIVRNGELVPLPISLMDFLKTELFSGSAKLRLLKEPFIPASEGANESVAHFIKRRLGKEVLDYAVHPFVSGIFAGDPEKLSIKHTFSILRELEQKHGSILKGMLKRKKNSTRRALISFKNGLQMLPEALCKKTGNAVKPDHRVTGISFSGDSWSLQFENGREAEHKVIISTLPAHALVHGMQDEKAAALISRLEGICYAPVSVIHLGFKREKIRHPLDGFGMLIPETEEYDILGTLFSSSLFPGRAPEGYVLLTSFVGGAENPERARQPKKDLVAEVQLALDRLLGISGTPEFVKHTFWENALPQYELGYDYFLETMNEIEKKFPGLYLAGNIRGGVSVPDCIENGLQKAEEIVNELL